jgi:hypothetical protein
MKRTLWPVLLGSLLLVGCSPKPKESPSPNQSTQLAAKLYEMDPATAGSIVGVVRFKGAKPPRVPVNMSDDPACVEAHHGKSYDEPFMIASDGGLKNAFIYIKRGLEGKTFATPTEPVVIDQHGCWFSPRVFGIQVNQPLRILNSDPVTHNIHPMAMVNREWNHSQGPEDGPVTRKFTKVEVMIPVKCNIHSWMHAAIGVLDHPYFAVSGQDGTFAIRNLPPGTYTLAVWHEGLESQEQEITVTAHNELKSNIVLKGH